MEDSHSESASPSCLHRVACARSVTINQVWSLSYLSPPSTVLGLAASSRSKRMPLSEFVDLVALYSEVQYMLLQSQS